MEKQELKSKWDDLAREIGAEISPETEQREAAVTTVAAESVSLHVEQAAVTVRAPLPKRAAGWDSLAGEFGLPTVEPTPPAVEESPPQQVEREASQELPARRPPQREREDRPQRQQEREDRPQDRGRGDRSQQRERGGRGRRPQQQRDRDEGRRDRREPREPEQRRRERPAQDVDRSDELEHVESPIAETAPPPRPQEESAKPPAVSLWHKIFGGPSEPVAKAPESPSVDFESERNEIREASVEFEETTEIRSLSGEDVIAGEFVDELHVSDSTASAEDSEEARRGRPRRRRRGGRGRRSGNRQPDDRSDSRREEGLSRVEKDFELDDELPDSDLDDELLGSGPQADDTEIDDDDAAVGATGGNRGKASQRAIPSWDEAIGFIVDSNMQSRSQRRPPSRSDSRGGSPRGRGRGRRKN